MLLTILSVMVSEKIIDKKKMFIFLDRVYQSLSIYVICVHQHLCFLSEIWNEDYERICTMGPAKKYCACLDSAE